MIIIKKLLYSLYGGDYVEYFILSWWYVVVNSCVEKNDLIMYLEEFKLCLFRVGRGGSDEMRKVEISVNFCVYRIKIRIKWERGIYR